MRLIRTLLMTAALAAPLCAQPGGEVALRAAVETETVKGDLKDALRQYANIATKYAKSDRATAASALIHMAECQQKMGNAEARKLYERVVRDYADQKESVATARARLAAMGSASGAVRARRLSTVNAFAYDTLSPDGQWLGGTDWIKGDLVLTHVSSGEIRRLVSAAFDKKPVSWAESPILSPDQKQVAYLWFDDGDPSASGGQIRLIANETAAKPRVLFSRPGEYKNVYPAAWSADSKRILASLDKRVQGRRIGYEIAWVSTSDGSVQVLATLEPWQVRPNSLSPLSLSPDGRYIAYSAFIRQGAPEMCIYLLAADGSSKTELVQGDINQDPIWTPDGGSIVFTSNRSGAFGLWAVPVRDGKKAGVPTVLKPDTGSIRAIGMAPSGSYFYNYDTRIPQIVVAEMEQAGGKARGPAINAIESFVGVVPAWSRDGKWLAFKRLNAGGENYNLIVHSMGSGAEWAIAPRDPMRTGVPVWYLDGSVRPIHRNTMRISVTNGQPREMPAPNALPAGALSADDKLLFRGANKDPQNNASPAEGIEVIEVASGERKQMFNVPGGVLAIALSPDGKMLSVVSRSGNGPRRLSRINIDGSGYREIYSGILGILPNQISWTRDGRSILFMQQDNDGLCRIMRIPVEGGQPELHRDQCSRDDLF